MITEKVLRERRREFELDIENLIGVEIEVGSYKALQREAKVLEASAAIMRIDKALEAFGVSQKREYPPLKCFEETTEHEHLLLLLEDSTPLLKEKGRHEHSLPLSGDSQVPPKEKGKREPLKKKLTKKDKIAFALDSK